MSDRLQQMVRVAQDEVNDMRARATRGAAQILSMAQAEADELVENSRQERRDFEADQHKAQDELRVRLEESRTRLAQMREEADGQRARLDAELAERRAHEEQALASDIAERRDVLMAELGTQEKRQRDEAQRIVDAASTQARAVVAEAAAEAERSRSSLRDQVTRAQDELEQLRALQHQVAEQLTGVRSLLDWTLPRVTSAAPVPSTSSGMPLGGMPPQAPAPLPRSPRCRLPRPPCPRPPPRCRRGRSTTSPRRTPTHSTAPCSTTPTTSGTDSGLDSTSTIPRRPRRRRAGERAHRGGVLLGTVGAELPVDVGRPRSAHHGRRRVRAAVPVAARQSRLAARISARR